MSFTPLPERPFSQRASSTPVSPSLKSNSIKYATQMGIRASSLGNWVKGKLPSRRPERGGTVRDHGYWEREASHLTRLNPLSGGVADSYRSRRSETGDSNRITRWNTAKDLPNDPPTQDLSVGRTETLHSNIQSTRAEESARKWSWAPHDDSGAKVLSGKHHRQDQHRLGIHPGQSTAINTSMAVVDEAARRRLSTERHIIESKRKSRQRKDLRLSGDFLGVQGINPETGQVDVLTPTDSEESSMSQGTKQKVELLQQTLNQARSLYKHTEPKLQAAMERIMVESKAEKLRQRQKRKEVLGQKVNQGMHWRRRTRQWASAQEPELSPILQSATTTAPASRKQSCYPQPNDGKDDIFKSKNSFKLKFLSKPILTLLVPVSGLSTPDEDDGTPCSSNTVVNTPHRQSIAEPAAPGNVALSQGSKVRFTSDVEAQESSKSFLDMRVQEENDPGGELARNRQAFSSNTIRRKQLKTVPELELSTAISSEMNEVNPVAYRNRFRYWTPSVEAARIVDGTQQLQHQGGNNAQAAQPQDCTTSETSPLTMTAESTSLQPSAEESVSSSPTNEPALVETGEGLVGSSRTAGDKFNQSQDRRRHDDAEASHGGAGWDDLRGHRKTKSFRIGSRVDKEDRSRHYQEVRRGEGRVCLHTHHHHYWVQPGDGSSLGNAQPAKGSGGIASRSLDRDSRGLNVDIREFDELPVESDLEHFTEIGATHIRSSHRCYVEGKPHKDHGRQGKQRCGSVGIEQGQALGHDASVRYTTQINVYTSPEHRERRLRKFEIKPHEEMPMPLTNAKGASLGTRRDAVQNEAREIPGIALAAQVPGTYPSYLDAEEDIVVHSTKNQSEIARDESLAYLVDCKRLLLMISRYWYMASPLFNLDSAFGQRLLEHESTWKDGIGLVAAVPGALLGTTFLVWGLKILAYVGICLGSVLQFAGVEVLFLMRV
ncbi:hypothetical protein S7711_00820 [Stachybotrys chartarum IBT 7711]|uniref:Uncharacterized protein n=1 Tax=Stachybotrys chartarum (strain CBS 109288 / IBT 7711) TaxID=1280523 RepID=A0A084B0A4_STACB|nr:hypothetical protein S7711_00820 [Stachybotrys chartarum IBT 7711]